MARPVLYDYPKSSAAYRVRIALNLKRVDYEQRMVNLLRNEQKTSVYRMLNPQGLLPVLEIDGHRLTQSLAIINYLDLRYPNSPLIPSTAADRAHVVAMAMAVACDIHPLQNLRVGRYLKDELGLTDEQHLAWNQHWIVEGLTALETMAKPHAGKFLFGDAPTGADVCLIPQLYNARRYKVPLDTFATLLRADENANQMEGFAAAHPDRQPEVTA